MNRILGKAFLLLFLLPFTGPGQELNSPTDTSALKPSTEEKIFKPTIALGTGMFSYFGDVGSAGYRSPLVSRIGYDLNVGKNLTDYLELNFHVIFGKLGGNERSIDRNLNFQSEIRAGGVSLVYNFHHFLPEKRNTEPWISAGIESFEFLSKTDLRDASGNPYHYWSDGSIMSLPENDPNAANAVYMQRDYIYETDIRESNTDGFGKYPERSFSIPVGAGIRFHLSDRVKFRAGSTMHFTFTDLVDGVTAESQGGRKGDSRNDWFMMTSGTISYDFMIRKKNKIGDFELPDDYFDDTDFFVLDTDDGDKDGIRDFIDKCAGTPEGVKVNADGCPLDDDADGVPNYADLEPNTPPGAFVNKDGEELTEEMIALAYEMYMDSTGKFAQVIKRERGEFLNPDALASGRVYMVQLGRFTGGIPADVINQFLSIPDITTRNENDSVTLYLAGRYPTNFDATRRMNEFRAVGLEGVVVEEINGVVKPGRPDLNTSYRSTNRNETVVEGRSNNQTTKTVREQTNTTTNRGNENTSGNTSNTTSSGQGNETVIKQYTDESFAANDPVNTVVFRVQLGAFKKRLSRDIFDGAQNLVEVAADDNLVKYLSGSFTDYSKAANHKVDMILKGFQGAFVVAYRNGKRISLSEAGATMAPKEEVTGEEEDEITEENLIDKNLVSFRVQLGAFRNEPPAELQTKMSQIQNVKSEITQSGLTRYTAGDFKTYEEANALKKRIADNHGLPDVFIVSYFKGQIIPVQEALELLK